MNIEEQMLLHEYDGINNNLKTFWTLRATFFGVSIPIFVLIITSTFTVIFPLKIFVDMALLLFIFVLIKMVGSLTRSLYIFSYRMADISKKLKSPDFWVIWPYFFSKNRWSTGSDSYVVIMKYINFAIGAYVIMDLSYAIISSSSIYTLTFGEISFLIIICLITLVCFVICYFMYVFYKKIDMEINPLYFHDDLLRKWDNASENAFTDEKKIFFQKQ